MAETVLVIEDNEQNLYLSSFLLRQHGYEVLAATDGPSGIKLAIESEPAFVLLDIQLPTMNGYEVAKSLRQVDALERTPIIAVTSYAMVGDREKCLEAGCDGYIEKPIDPETFVVEIERIRSNDRGAP